jgi:enterochelin esterase-like enzyme
MNPPALRGLLLVWCCSTVFAQQPTTPSAVVAPAASAGAANEAPTRIVSPEVHPDRRVTFRLNAPKATEVLLRGEFMRGTQSLERDTRGVWSITVGPLEPEIYHYNFILDGLRIIDPGNAQLKTGSAASTLQSSLEIRADTAAFYDGQPVPHGEIRTHWYESKSLQTLRRVTVYVPPGYDDNSQTRYPVLYLLHGANADENAWHRIGRANLILDNLLAAKKSKPFLVIMPFGYGVPPGAAQSDNTARFSEDLRQDLIPYIDARYRTQRDREQRALAGLSMGGDQALRIGLNHLDIFSHIGSFSPGLGRGSNFAPIYARLIAEPAVSNEKLKLLWIGCGREDDDSHFGGSKRLSAFLTQHQITHTFRETDGAHTWMVWRRYLHEIAPLLFQ